MAYPSSLDSLRTDLTGADDAAAVDHAGLHNAVNAAVTAVQAELGLDPSGAAATVAARLAEIEADSRWTNPRTPTAHKVSHATGGSDALSPADIGAATSAQGAKADSAVQPTLIDAKGDLLVGAAADNLMRLPAAADGRMLTTDGSQATGMRWATPTTRVGTGSPLGIVVPDFVGQEFVDTLQTLGARKWVATGTTAASWVVSDGDTGWLPITVSGWTGVTGVRCEIRRVVAQVMWRLAWNASASASGVGAVSVPAGFRYAPSVADFSESFFDAATYVGRFLTSAGQDVSLVPVASQNVRAKVLHPTSQSWPTAAPV